MPQNIMWFGLDVKHWAKDIDCPHAMVSAEACQEPATTVSGVVLTPASNWKCVLNASYVVKERPQQVEISVVFPAALSLEEVVKELQPYLNGLVHTANLAIKSKNLS